jgi:hypothetical protein
LLHHIADYAVETDRGKQERKPCKSSQQETPKALLPKGIQHQLVHQPHVTDSCIRRNFRHGLADRLRNRRWIALKANGDSACGDGILRVRIIKFEPRISFGRCIFHVAYDTDDHAPGVGGIEIHLLSHETLEQFPLLLNFDMDSSHYLTLLLVGQPLLRRTLSLQLHEALRQRIAVHYHLEGLTREELDDYLAQQLKAAGISQPLFDDTATQALYQATKGILRKVNKLAVTALRLAALRKTSLVNEATLLDATSEALL